MKYTSAVAAALLGAASAEVHKMKLQKVSLDEQLVRPPQSSLTMVATANKLSRSMPT